MSCRTQKPDGETVYTLPNGSESELFSSLKRATGNVNRSIQLYEQIHSKPFKKWYGKDWEKNYTPDLFSDNNGEPKLVIEDGFYSFKNGKGDTWEIALEIKERSDALNMGREVQEDLVNMLVGFINDVRTKNPNVFRNRIEVEKYFGIGKDSAVKGTLADKLLTEAFPGATTEQAKELYRILEAQGDVAMFNALPDNVTLNENGTDEYIAWEVFTGAYSRWNSIINPTTGNIESIGVREVLKDSLSNYGIKLQDRVGAMEEFEDTPEKIYSIVSLQEDPRTKLSTEAKAILGNIVLNELNIFGYPKVLSMEKAYAIISEATVGEPTYSEMLSNIDFLAQYKPEAIAIRQKLDELTAREEAALFTNFRASYNNFILFKSEGYTDETTNITSYTNKIINSNKNQVSKNALERFKLNSRERLFLNERALYQLDPITGTIVGIKEGKIEQLENLWDKIWKVKQEKGGRWDVNDINTLGEYLWTLGMDLGPTLADTQNNLLKYYNIGNESFTIQSERDSIVLFDQLVFTPLERFSNFLNVLKRKNPGDIYKVHGSLVNKIAELTPLFTYNPFGSFISETGKQYYPIGLPSRLNELVSTINNPKIAGKKIELLNQFLNDPLFRPYGSIKYSSPLVSILHSNKSVRDNFTTEVLDAYKGANEFVATMDYENQPSRISLIERLIAYNNNENKTFTKIAVPIQAGRESLDFITIPRISSYSAFGVNANRTDLIKSIIIQDLARINQADEAIENAYKTQDISNLIEGYHYTNPADPYARDGSVFSMTQIFELLDKVVTIDPSTGVERVEYTLPLPDGSEMSEYVKAYATGADFLQKDEFDRLLAEKTVVVEERLKVYEENLKERLTTYNIRLLQDVNNNLDTPIKQNEFLKDFVFENFIGKIELVKMLRSGFSFAKNSENFYKRMSLLKTPGNKLFIKGMSETDPEWGMPSTYNIVTIRDFNFTNLDIANKVADDLEIALAPEGSLPGFDPKAKEIADKYRNVNKTDAQSFISLDMYRGIMQGMGQWSRVDEEAYKNAMNPDIGLYIDNDENPRPIYPLKPYHEEISMQNGVNTLFMDKNSYVVITPELAQNYPYLQEMLKAMNNGIDVVHTESTNKGAKINVQDFQTLQTLDQATPIALDSNMLRFPQLSPRTIKDKVAFNRQIRKNLIANIQPGGEYLLGDISVLGEELLQIYGETIAVNIEEDTKIIRDALGITALNKLRGKEGTKEYRDAKLNYLIKIRNRVREQIKDRDLPNNYLDALNIVPNGAFDWRFKIPLSFPNYQAKFEGIFLSIFHNELFNQKLKGKELTQVAELGGHIVSRELEFYDGNNPAQIRVKASTLGLPPGTRPQDVDPERLTVIGYRIPQQGKNSSLVMQIVDFLPESHEKAVMVPGGITVQMGSDFDFDKLYLIYPEVDIDNNIIKPDYNKNVREMSRAERNNVIFDTFRAILTDPKHLNEVVTPLTAERLEIAKDSFATKLGMDAALDYNNPMTEIEMEERAKEGARLIGLWSNQLSGRNVAEVVKNLSIRADFAPIINDIPYAQLGVTKDMLGNYTDSNISEHQSAAVDYANNPLQIFINDNMYTNPVLGLLYSAGISMDIALNFINQPIIREATNYALNNALSIGRFGDAINYVAQKHKIKNLKLREVTSMDPRNLEVNLENPDPKNQEAYLINFNNFFLAGKALQTVNKVITPDNLDNVTELSAINSWIDTENLYLNNPDSLIQGAEEVIRHHQGTNIPLNPIAIAYRNIFNTIIDESNKIGFLNNFPAFTEFKKNLKDSLGQSTFTAAQHKLIDRALFLKIMTQPNSPFVDGGFINENNFKSMYTSPDNNLVTRLKYIKEAYPQESNNLILQSLEADPSNEETGLFLLRLNIPIGISTADKNELTKDFLKLISSNDKNLRNFGHLLVANQILTTGFNPTFGSYIDLIPSEVFTEPILNPGKQTPVEFFKQEAEELMKVDYFTNFIHDFVRTYGLQKPKGAPLLKTIKKLPNVDNKGFVSFSLKTPQIYGNDNKTLDYFLSFYKGKSAIFVHVEGGKYQLLSLLGRSRKLTESGVIGSNSESLVNQIGTINRPGPRKAQPVEPIIQNEDIQAEKVCKVSKK